MRSRPDSVTTQGNTRIYVCAHGDFTPVVHNPVYEVVDGREYGDVSDRGLPGLFYSELASYRRIALRSDLPEYVGVCGYRKYFSFMDDVPDMAGIFSEYDAVAGTPAHFNCTVRRQYAGCLNVADFDIMTHVISTRHPELLPAWAAAAERNDMYACNMFILRRDDFRWLVDAVFRLLDGYIDVVGTDILGRIYSHMQDYHIATTMDTRRIWDMYRIGGHLGERVTNALLRHRFRNIKHYDIKVTGGASPRNTTSLTVKGQMAMAGIDHKRLAELLTPYDIDGLTKMRLGRDCDGGYVVPRELVMYVSHLASCGIGDETSFECDLLDRNKECTATLFDQRFVSTVLDAYADRYVRCSVTLGKEYGVPRIVAGHKRVLLKADIEGAEYDIFYPSPSGEFSGLRGVAVLVMEIHSVAHDPRAIRLLQDIEREMTLFHVHGNLFGGSTETDVGSMPNVLELTFVAKSLGGARYRSDTKYPSAGVDRPNDWWRADMPLDFIRPADRTGTFVVPIGGRTAAELGDIVLRQLRVLYPGWRLCAVASGDMLRKLHLADVDAEGIDENTLLDREATHAAMRAVAPALCGRFGWYYQQFLKYKFCMSPHNTGSNYVVMDGDTVPLRRIRFMDGDVYLFNRKPEHHAPYFETIQRLFPGIDDSNQCAFGHSFISEYMVFDTEILTEMLTRLGPDWVRTILEATSHASNKGIGFSEYETYGTYMANFHKARMRSIHLRTCRCGSAYLGTRTPSWPALVGLSGMLDTITFE